MMLSNRVKNLQESATLKVNAMVNRLKADGKVIYNLTAGEPDFAPSTEAKNAVIDAVNKNLSKYTPTPGIAELRELIAKKTNDQQPLVAQQKPWKASDVVVTNGGKQAIFDTIMVLIDRGDEVIIPSPYWLSYPEMVKAAEGTVKVVTTTLEAHYKMTAAQLSQAITPKTKMVILNSPSNPTGSLYSRAELVALGEVLQKNPQIFIISDEIYDKIEFTVGSWCSFLDACPLLRDRTITVNGLSKSGAMTGWRIGWSVSSENITAALICLQGHSTSGICSLSQAAGVATLKLPPDSFEVHRRQYLHRRNLALEVLRKSAKIKVYEPEGAFYLFLDVKAALQENQNANGFAEAILQDQQVAVVSGVDFGAPTCVRISFATDDATIQTACQRIVDYCNRV
jgi:aspartate aminotransferase